MRTIYHRLDMINTRLAKQAIKTRKRIARVKTAVELKNRLLFHWDCEIAYYETKAEQERFLLITELQRMIWQAKNRAPASHCGFYRWVQVPIGVKFVNGILSWVYP
jgi:hypothetical protein